MSRPVRRVAFFGYLRSGNVGSDATFETVLAWLRSTQPDVEVRCVTIAPDEVIARYGAPSVPLAWGSSHTGGNRVTEASRKLLGRLLMDASWLLAQIRAAREDARSLINRIRRGPSEYADEVESLLQQVAREALGLTPRPSHRLDVHDEIDAWHGS